jgi:hypothetical protein
MPLDGLLRVDPGLGVARASWLRGFAVAACPKDMHEEMDKLEFLWELGAGQWDLRALPAARVVRHASTRRRRRPELSPRHHSQDHHPDRGHLESLRTW